MKKILFFLTAALLVANYSFAQYKPEKGSISTEVQFNPFDKDGNTFKLDGIKVRYFFTDKDAFRVKLGFGLKNDNFSVSNDEGPEEGTHATYFSQESEYKSNSGNVELNLGYERHFDLGKRLSAYVGASVGFNRHFASTNIEMTETRHYWENNRWRSDITSNAKAEISNGTFTSLPEGDIDENPLNLVDDRAYWEVKAALFAGVDFYVYKGLYLGTELGLGLNSAKSSQMKFKVTDSEESDMVEYKSNDSVRKMNVGFYIEPVLRLGWTF